MLGEELTEYSRSCPAWLACGSGQERGKAEKKMTKVRSLHWSHIVIILVVSKKNHKLSSRFNNILVLSTPSYNAEVAFVEVSAY